MFLLGLLMFATWIYSVVIIIRKTKETTWYEKTENGKDYVYKLKRIDLHLFNLNQ